MQSGQINLNNCERIHEAAGWRRGGRRPACSNQWRRSERGTAWGRRSRTGVGAPVSYSVYDTFLPWAYKLGRETIKTEMRCQSAYKRWVSSIHKSTPKPKYKCLFWPANCGDVSLVLTETVDALDGSGLDVVPQEKTVIPPGPPAGLLHHHEHHGLNRMAVSRHTVPVIPLQL